MSRKNPIHNGILKSDLDANGHKIKNLEIEVSDAQIKKAIKPELEDLSARVKDLEDNIGSDVITAGKFETTNGTIFDDGGIYNGEENRGVLFNSDGSVVIFNGGTEAVIDSGTDGPLATQKYVDDKLSENDPGPAVEVVAPNSSAKGGQAADAEAVYKNFRLKNDLGYVISEVKTVPVWAFSLAIDGEEFDTVDMTLQSSSVSGDTTNEDWAGDSTEGKHHCELHRAMRAGQGIETFRATINGVSVSSTLYTRNPSSIEALDFSGMKVGDSSLTASGTYSPAKQVEVVTADDKIALEGTVKEELRKLKEDSLPMVETTHAELLTLRNSSQLVPGMQYRITDYVATTKQSNTKSANHPFDIIVTADDEKTLNEVARAIRHEGDTYFANCKLEAWKIWYCLDNDTNRFAWADSTDGKGVIYRMIDEWDNDVPYDFKGILTKAYLGAEEWSSDYQYTFGGSADETVKELSTCFSNKMGFYIPASKQRINQNIFGSYCTNNSFGSDCYDNSFGSYCHDNSFGSDCYDNSFGSDCYDNSFGSYCHDNSFGSDCYDNTFGADEDTPLDHYQYITFGNGCKGLNLYCTASTSWEQVYKNVEIKSGVTGEVDEYGDLIASKTITDDNVNQSFHTTYKPVGSMEVSV